MLCKEQLTDESIVARFIKDRRNLIKRNPMRVSANAFIYPKDNKALSLAHIDGLSIEEIWNFGDTVVFKNALLVSNEKFKTVARADMNVGKLKSLSIEGFNICRDNSEFDRHVTAISNMEKQAFAVRLSANCELIIR
jgi:hypothetical protein